MFDNLFKNPLPTFDLNRVFDNISFSLDDCSNDISEFIGKLDKRFSNLSLPVSEYFSDDNTKYNIEVAAAGVNEKDIDIHVTDRTLTIKINHSDKEEEKNKKYIRNKISRRQFEMSRLITECYDLDKINCELKNGLLKVTIPVIEIKEKPISTKKIEINLK